MFRENSYNKDFPFSYKKLRKRKEPKFLDLVANEKGQNNDQTQMNKRQERTDKNL